MKYLVFIINGTIRQLFQAKKIVHFIIISVIFFQFLSARSDEISDLINETDEISNLKNKTDEISDLLNKIDAANSLCSGNAKKNCQLTDSNIIKNKKQEAAKNQTTIEKLALGSEKVTIKDLHDRDLQISIIDEEDINKIKDFYPDYLRPNDPAVCAQRAHTIGNSLAENGIETVKLIIQPEGSWFSENRIIPDENTKSSKGTIPEWKFHVANIIYVRTKNNQIVQYVIDPFMERDPVPREKWEKRLRTNPDSSIGSMDIASRYVLNHKDLNNFDLKYYKNDLQRSYEIMRGAVFH